MQNPEWLDTALRELGTAEIPGPASNPRVIEYHKSTTLKATDDAVPWCSAFACWCMEETGIRSPRSARARDWLTWGVELKEPLHGCIVVLKRGSNPAQGHVGFYLASSSIRVLVLGGNQGDRVCKVWFPMDRVLGYRWPTVAAFGGA